MLSIKRILIVFGAIALAAALSPERAAAQRSGVEIWAQTCGNCHVTQPAARYSAENWQRLMRHMMITARMTDDEAAAVRRFLMGSARQIVVGAAGNDQTERVGPGRVGSRTPEVAKTDLTATRQSVPASLTPEEVQALVAYLRTIIGG